MLYGVAVLGLGLTSAEFAARIDDRLFGDVPLLANPDRELDLTVRDENGLHGRPFGMFRKWKLDNFGFLGPDIAPTPTARRVMVLGASETFGLYESAGNDYPSRLRKLLSERGNRDVEIVNAGMAGMALPTLLQYWRSWAGGFGAKLVLVYPSPHFYLDDEPPRIASAPPPARAPAALDPRDPLQWSRFAVRIKDLVRQIQILRDIRAYLVVRQALRGKGPDYLFTADPPTDRIVAFTRDLEQLSAAIVERGATPVLVTHAFRYPSPPARGDLAELRYFRMFLPRATPEAMPAFDLAARDAVLDLGRRRGWTVIDAAPALNGQRHLFADPVHFNDAGSLAMARQLVGPLEALLQSRGGQN